MYDLRFIGNIQLNNQIELFCKTSIIDNAKFSGNGSLFLNPDYKEYKHTLGYFRNSDLNYLTLHNVNNIWFSGDIKANSIEIIGTSLPLLPENYCTFNHGTKSTLTISSKLSINNVNCINIQGSVYAPGISISANKQAEIYIAPNAQLQGLNEMHFSSGENVLHLNYGSIYSKNLLIQKLQMSLIIYYLNFSILKN